MVQSLLIVRHAPGAGRIPGYMDPVLESLRKRSPESVARIRLHELGGASPDLEDVVAIVFWLADPLREHFPDCHAHAVALADRARERGIRLINPPESLSNSIKSRQSKAWREAGIETPLWTPYDHAERVPALVREAGFPVIVRSDDEHVQKNLHVLYGERDLARLDPAEIPVPGVVGAVWDVRATHEAENPRGIYARLHHKKRLYVLGDRVRTEHVFFAKQPVVSAKTCTFRLSHKLDMRFAGLSRMFLRDRTAIREDLEYWRRNEELGPLMIRAAGVLGFGFAAIDYSTRADGSPILWEANPHPSLPTLCKLRLPERRLGAQRIESYHRAIGEFLTRLLEPNAVGAHP